MNPALCLLAYPALWGADSYTCPITAATPWQQQASHGLSVPGGMPGPKGGPERGGRTRAAGKAVDVAGGGDGRMLRSSIARVLAHLLAMWETAEAPAAQPRSGSSPTPAASNSTVLALSAAPEAGAAGLHAHCSEGLVRLAVAVLHEGSAWVSCLGGDGPTSVPAPQSSRCSRCGVWPLTLQPSGPACVDAAAVLLAPGPAASLARLCVSLHKVRTSASRGECMMVDGLTETQWGARPDPSSCTVQGFFFIAYKMPSTHGTCNSMHSMHVTQTS